MNINTEAAELLHAVADLYECGALKRIKPGQDSDYVRMSLSLAVVCASRELFKRAALLEALGAVTTEANLSLFCWQRRKGRTTKDVIALLRRAAQKLEQA